MKHRIFSNFLDGEFFQTFFLPYKNTDLEIFKQIFEREIDHCRYLIQKDSNKCFFLQVIFETLLCSRGFLPIIFSLLELLYS